MTWPNTESASTVKGFILAFALIAVALFSLAIVIFISNRGDDPWDPLGDYPLQRVTNTLPGFTTPAVRVDGELTVEATKCVKTDTATTATPSSTTAKDGFSGNASGIYVKGGSRWASVDPTGYNTIYQLGQSFRLPGCTRTTYTSPIPDEVKGRVIDLCTREGRCQTVWRKDGYEIPVDSHGNEGAQRLWFTGNFTIVVNP